ncbi:MAG TPA: 1,2-phenylacetyl-CoA epoxidase subunit PaaD [Chitinophagales bacterium]|nr:1,2-phenylacetyl-CoA epoxidase subunit PaaD [Chitinophagales bacterium]
METGILEITEEQVWFALENVKDPEIPVLTVVDMGMITGVAITDNSVVITMTPTFVGCPAIHVIKQSIYDEVKKLGFDSVEVKVDFETKWTSDRMKDGAKEKLEKFGLAPPVVLNDDELTEEQLNRVRCPHCHSTDTTLRSAFGSTLCRAIRFCFNCKQGFEQFKPV